jgi:hypothetical protein
MAGKKTFVAGEVLLAQDVNDFLMDQSVMNFATSAARSSAIPTPTEGMTTYVQDRNQIETFDGTEYRGMSGLQLVKKQTIETAVSSVVVNDAFSATYDNYKIVLSGGAGSESASNFLQIGNAATGYYASFNGRSFANAAITGGVANGTRFYFGEGATSGLFGIADICNPFKNLVTTMTGNANLISTIGYSYVTGGFLNNTNSYTSFTINPNSGTFTGGTIYVYGYGT